MHIVVFTHSLVSDWNHGNAHFLRGVLRELVARGHSTVAYEPADGWSRRNLLAEQGSAAVARFDAEFPELTARCYAEPASLDLNAMLDGPDLVIVHEWTEPELVAAIGRHRVSGGRYTLLFHDTHHRAISAEGDMAGLDLEGYDGVLAFGEVLSETYRRHGWGRRVFTWHEAADTRLFRPHPEIACERDLIWIGNWGDGERSDELDRFLVTPVERAGLDAVVHGVRYPAAALERLQRAGIDYRGWLANTDVPLAFAGHRCTVHVPRRPYVEQLPGIPTIRVFEALACGIPLVSAPWRDEEGLFRSGEDYLVARTSEEMTAHLRRVVCDPALAESLRMSGLTRILARHTCAHRVDELLLILGQIGTSTTLREGAEAAA